MVGSPNARVKKKMMKYCPEKDMLRAGVPVKKKKLKNYVARVEILLCGVIFFIYLSKMQLN